MKFMRRNPEYGTAYFAIGEKTIKIEGREVYETDDKKEIAFLKKDPEVVEDTTIDAEIEDFEPKKDKTEKVE